MLFRAALSLLPLMLGCHHLQLLLNRSNQTPPVFTYFGQTTNKWRKPLSVQHCAERTTRERLLLSRPRCACHAAGNANTGVRVGPCWYPDTGDSTRGKLGQDDGSPVLRTWPARQEVTRHCAPTSQDFLQLQPLSVSKA